MRGEGRVRHKRGPSARLAAEPESRRGSPPRASSAVAIVIGLLASLAAAVGASTPAGALSSHRSPLDVRRRGSGEIGRVIRVLEGLHVPGGAIGVTGGTAGTVERAFGVARPRHAMTLSDHFRIGSITKTFTATVILELVDRHRLRLSDRLSAWEPRVPDARRITVAMLLDMRSGIWDEGGTGPGGKPSLLSQWVSNHCRDHDLACGRRMWSPQEIVNLAIRQGRAYPPGTWYYSDTNYVILGIIAQDVTRRPLATLVRKLVLDPLHLTQTSFPVRSLAIPRPATVGYRPAGGGRYRVANVLSPSATFGYGNMISTLRDLQRWARDLARGALLVPRTSRVRDRVVDTGVTDYPLTGTGVSTSLVLRYGLGLTDLSNLLGHNGFVPPDGYSAEMWSLPRGRGTVVELFNSIATCEGAEYLADAVNTSLVQAVFAPALYRVAGPELGCPPAPVRARKRAVTSPVRG
jgi:D-alanyl-D-alanine carboxypeptidase